MSFIKIYVLDEYGYLDHARYGDIEATVLSTEDSDFTLTPPPDYEHQWRWIDNKWTTDDTAN